MYDWGEAYKRDGFAERPKREGRKVMGREYTDFLLNCLKSQAGDEIEDVIVFRENSPIDLVWRDLSLGLEGKRFMKTKFKNDGHVRAWLKQEFFERFPMYQKDTGLNLRVRILCITKKPEGWSSKVDEWLARKGYYLLVTGGIDFEYERERATLAFIDQFTDVLFDIAEGTARRQID